MFKGIMLPQETLHVIKCVFAAGCFCWASTCQQGFTAHVWVIPTAVSQSLGRERVKKEAFCCQKPLKVFIKKNVNTASITHTSRLGPRDKDLAVPNYLHLWDVLEECAGFSYLRGRRCSRTSLRSLKPQGIFFRCHWEILIKHSIFKEAEPNIPFDSSWHTHAAYEHIWRSSFLKIQHMMF